ncbi:MAG TPA: LysM peptidoglycan-binding domain-containing protein [Longimicrobium sp.]|nr:LysM peptidoglycan-binding domain-containing protein [Longimicrobium sp.]
MPLEKALITVEDGAKKGTEIRVLFNPAQYQLNQSIQVSAKKVPGLSAPVRQFTAGRGRSLSMSLFFDTYEEGTDVRGYTNLIYGLLDIDETLHRPPVCSFAWGGFSLTCLVQSVNGTFKMFLPSGVPVRAELGVSLKEYLTVELQAKETKTQSADHAKRFTVRRGDTLATIAAAEYGDPARWRVIAEANGIADPMAIRPGDTLRLPAL